MTKKKMKFKNTYELLKYLFENGKIKSIYFSFDEWIYNGATLNSTIKNKTLFNYIESEVSFWFLKTFLSDEQTDDPLRGDYYFNLNNKGELIIIKNAGVNFSTLVWGEGADEIVTREVFDAIFKMVQEQGAADRNKLNISLSAIYMENGECEIETFNVFDSKSNKTYTLTNTQKEEIIEGAYYSLGEYTNFNVADININGSLDDMNLLDYYFEVYDNGEKFDIKPFFKKASKPYELDLSDL